MLNNILLMTDSYKVSHYLQYPPHTTKVYSYLEARTGGEYKDVMFFGLQYYLKRYLCGVVVTKAKIRRAAKFFKSHFGRKKFFHRSGWEHILKEHSGKLPVLIRAVPEGLCVSEGNVLMTIENTCPECYWLTNYLETLLVQVWYGSTVGTISREMKKIVWAALERSGTATVANLLFRVHDFGYRGVSSPESAALGGAAHLVNFLGSDTLAACELLMEYYGADMPGFSIPAAEHSTITSWGEEGEADSYENLLRQYPEGILAVVSDSWNIFHAVEKIWGEKLKDLVLAREGVLVMRPDSGVPEKILPLVLEAAGRAFGYTVNAKGYKVLNDKVRIIQGDGIKRSTLKAILDAIMDAGWSADCISFGSGGGLLQDCNRDTQRFAMKCSYIEFDGGESSRDVYKRPATDPTKNSKRGKLKLVRRGNRFETVSSGSSSEPDVLSAVFLNGYLLIDHKLVDVRARAAL